MILNLLLRNRAIVGGMDAAVDAAVPPLLLSQVSIVDLWPSRRNPETENTQSLFISHTLEHGMAQLSATGASYLIHIPIPAESWLRPLELSIHRALSAAVAWIFELRRLQRIGGTASPQSTAKGQIHCLEATSPERCYDGILVGAARQIRLSIAARPTLV